GAPTARLVPPFRPPAAQAGPPDPRLEVAARGLDKEVCPGDPVLMYCRALALARSGSTTRADRFVHDLLARQDLPAGLRSDALSLAGRVRKDIAAGTADDGLRATRLRAAFDFYCQAYERGGDTFPGINAASLALLLGLPERSRQ